MLTADRRVKCPVCASMIEVGDNIVWETFRWHGIDQRHPMHARHDTNFTLMRSKLDTLMARAAQTSNFDPSDCWVI